MNHMNDRVSNEMEGFTSGRSVLVLSKYKKRRLATADAFRNDGAIVVEAATVHQVHAILQQLRFDVLAVDFHGLGVAAIELFHDLRIDHPRTFTSVIGSSVDGDMVARGRWECVPHQPNTHSKESITSGGAALRCKTGTDRAFGRG